MSERTKLEALYIKRRLAGKLLSPVRSLKTDAYPLGRPFAVTTKWNLKSPIGQPWSLGRHTGEDYACPEGMHVVSVSWGEVIWAGTSGGWSRAGSYGKHVIVRTGDDEFDYAVCHLSAMRVNIGDKVRPGTLLGLSGSTGNVSGPHVHFEARPAGGGFGSDINPRLVRRKSS